MDLKEFYHRQILPKIKDYQEEYKHINDRSVRRTFLGITISLALFALITLSNPSLWGTAVIGGLVVVIFLVCISLKERSEAHRKLLLVVTNEMVRKYYPELNCQPDNFIKKESFNRSDLFTKPDRYRGSMLVEGVVDGVPLAFSYVHAEKKHEETEHDEEGFSSTRTYYSTIFSGLFMNFKPPLMVSNDVIIRPAGRMKGLFRLLGIPGRHKLVEFENPDFNRAFTVSTSDIVDAHMVVTPRFMEEYLKLKRTLARSIYMSIVSGWVYVAVSGIKPPYSGLFSNPAEFEFVEKFDRFVYEGINIFRELMKILPLKIAYGGTEDIQSCK